MRVALALLAILSATVDARKCDVCWLTSLQCTPPTGTPSAGKPIATTNCNFGYSDGSFSKDDTDNGLEPLSYQVAMYTGCGKGATDPAYCNATSSAMKAKMVFGSDGSSLSYAATIPYIDHSKGVRLFSLAAVGSDIQMVELSFPRPDSKTNKLSSWKGKDVTDSNKVLIPSTEPLAAIQAGSLSTWCTFLGASGNWLIESRVEINIQATVLYRYAVGQIPKITATYAMPDKKTLYVANDKYLFMFVSDHAKDLTSGHLYVAKMGSKDVKWLDMGKTNATAVKDEMKKGLKFDDYKSSGKIKAGMEGVASRLFPEDYASMLGATEMSGITGLTYNMDDKGATGKEAALGAFFVSFAGSMKSSAFGGTDQTCGTIYKFDVGSLTTCDLSGAKCTSDEKKKAKAVCSLGLKTFEPDFVAGGSCKKIQDPIYINFASYHNMLFVADSKSKVWAVDFSGNGISQEPVLIFEAVGNIAGITWLSNLVGDGRSYLSINVGDAKTGNSYIGYLGPFTLKGYMSGSYDVLHNIGCPIRGKDDYLYEATKYVDPVVQ
ncbi:hypothetical protein GUITHDRAFT_166161 [Guillardia theta CCMP2712]|uniref:Uncharacterized protein n=1 Tax=Guillardia theta (strain CCMP2712) TaxID=905079 RepID=L1IFN6_GUITC|nr:hypothetical protein GUITHDRAFT_166161 [Guillardia theta CCMP2712]EKX34655.1 hypothetical protein GUITHDRAFT_166161 [Guillardia theta CCMP2712]|eukprot:XP_005821635.1 hypothetical protein GUITHDRAFT_166161 [Guillardia theta CCMP2712]